MQTRVSQYGQQYGLCSLLGVSVVSLKSTLGVQTLKMLQLHKEMDS